MKQDLMHKDVNDVNITPEERRSIWQLWRQNLKDWAWYIRENPDWLDLDIQTAVKRHVIAPLREGWHRLRSLAHQKKRREFPESENRLAQLLLFAWGSMPRMGAGPAGAVCPAPQAQHPPQRQHPGPAGAAAPAPGHLPGHLRHGGGGDRAAVGIHHRHHRPL